MSNTGRKGKLNKENVTEKVLDKAKIRKLPKTIQDSIPYETVYKNGIIETEKGVFTRSYQLDETNFKTASDEEQLEIFRKYGNFLNSFDENTRWQINIFNHAVDKAETMEQIRIRPAKDGLNVIRQAMNNVYLDKLADGKNDITQSKFLTISINDSSITHASDVIRRIDKDISKSLKKITGRETSPMTLEERLQLLHNIYNPDDPELANIEIENELHFSLDELAKQGLISKDVIGPNELGFKKNSFDLSDKKGTVFFIPTVPSFLTTDFIADLTDLSINMLISLTHTAMNGSEAIKLAKARLSDIESDISQKQQEARDSGVGYGMLPPELEKAWDTARGLMTDIMSRNQKLFLITFTIAVFADNQTELDDDIALIKSTCEKHVCTPVILSDQQEFALNNTLPLCRDDLFVDQLHTTETASVFIPYTSQELMQKNAIFYGLNSVTKNMILYNRLSGKNYNGLIFGGSGSGKSFTAKLEMIAVLLRDTKSRVYIIDPDGEYTPMVEAFGGQIVYFAFGSKTYINPLDLNLEDGDDPVAEKTDYILSLIDIMIGGDNTLDPIAKSIVIRCVKSIYTGYIKHCVDMNLPIDISYAKTLRDLYEELKMQPEIQANSVASVIEPFAVGAYDLFSHRTNIETDNRIVCFNIQKLGPGLKALGLFICSSYVWNEMLKNFKKKIYTWFYIDEFHLLLQTDNIIKTMVSIWKRARKFLGVPTGITQNTAELLRTKGASGIINNTDFVLMLSLPKEDRQNLQILFGLSDSQLDYITESDKGSGLLYNGKITIPFENEFPKDNPIYRIISTSSDTNEPEDRKTA